MILETIKLTYNDKTILVDLDGNQLQTTNTETQIPFFLSVISESEVSIARSQAGLSIVSIILTFGTSTLISLLLGNTIEATWLLLGSIQLMSFVALFNLDLPSNFREFSKNLAVLHGEPQALPNIFESQINTTGLEPYNRYFELMSMFHHKIIDFNTELLLMNSGRKMLLWMIMLTLMGISFLVFDLFSEISFM